MRPFAPAYDHSIDARCQRALVVTVALALSLAQAESASAATYYVDNQSASCSNAGAGTEAQPYCAISAAVAAHAGPGTTIIVKPGIYREQVTIPASGASGTPFVIQAQGPGVVIDGADVFTGAGSWLEMAPQGLPADYGLTAIDNPWLATGVIWPPQQVFLDGRRLMPSTASPALLPNDAFTWVSGEGLYVNIGGSNPGLREVLVGRRNYGFSMNAKSWVTIDGFEITRSESRGINLQLACADLVISRNRVTRSQSYGIQAVGGAKITIEDNVVSDCGLHGIGLTAGSVDCIVRSNESFRNADPAIRRATGIYLHAATGTTIYGNRVHDNQDSGMHFAAGANNSLSYNNRSWNNGDHGYDHLDASGTVHVNDVAFGNYKDGFSIEANSPYTQLHNCIGVDNGLATDEFDLWVNDLSSVGFVSDYNIFWNSNGQEPFKFVTTSYATLAGYQAASGQDAHSLQADPRFVNGPAGDFTLGTGSPAIDAGIAGVPGWPPTDASGQSRVDDPMTTNSGTGPVVYADIGVLEYVPIVGLPPVVTSPGNSLSSSSDTNLRARWGAGSLDGSPGQERVSIGTDGPGASAGAAALSSGFASELTFSNGHPNPSRGPVEFALDTPRESEVRWAVFDLQGRMLWSEERTIPAGRTQLRWDGRTSTGGEAATGIYLVRAMVDGARFSRRVVRF